MSGNVPAHGIAPAAGCHYATADGTARAVQDYSTVRGTLIFAPRQARQTIAEPVLGATRKDSGETFAVVLSNPSNAAIARGRGLGTILDAGSPVRAAGMSQEAVAVLDQALTDLTQQGIARPMRRWLGKSRGLRGR